MTTTTETQWEYKVTTLGSWRGAQDDEVEAALNELGQAGWEVITASPIYGSGKVMVVARRPLTRSRRRARGEAWGEGE